MTTRKKVIDVAIHDYKCRKCGHAERNIYYKRPADIPQVRECGSCGRKRSVQVFDQSGTAQIHNDHSSMYGKWHPQAGEVIRDYSHKRELMKKYGWVEGSDPVKGNRKLSEEAFDDDGQPEPGSGGASWMTEDQVKDFVKNPTDIGIN